MTNPWSGWKNEAPTQKQRTNMYKKCGKKCFLGSKKSFPICIRNTCKVSKRGVYAAYVRSRQYRKRGSKYYSVSRKAKNILRSL